MSAVLIGYAIGNALLAVPLALLAWAVGRRGRNPSIAHLAWTLVLVRLVLPPIDAMPWLSIHVPVAGALLPDRPATQSSPERVAGADAAAQVWSAGGSDAAATHSAAPSGSPAHRPSPDPERGAFSVTRGSEMPAVRLPSLSTLGVAAWMCGTSCLVAISAMRVLRFRRILRTATATADLRIRRLAERAASSLGMTLRSDVRLTSANAVPFVWWCFGRPQIVLPASLTSQMRDEELILVLTHELAHVRRRDHLVRWLDCIASAWLWWNPLVWIARRGVRINEELACDSLVLRTRDAAARSYGHCLVTVAESIGGSAFRAPALACTMGDRGSLEERIRIIMSDTLRTRPRPSLRLATAAVAGITMMVNVAHSGQPQPETQAASPAAPATPAAPAAPAPPTAPAVPGAPAAPASDEWDGDTRTLRQAVEGAASLRVTTMNGSITVTRDDTVKAMQVTAVLEMSDGTGSAATRRQTLERAKLVAQKDSAGRVSVSVDFGGATHNLPSVDFAILVPALASVEAETMNGSVRTIGDVGDVSAETMNGTIDVAGAKANVKATSMNGGVKIALADGATAPVEAECTNGKVALEMPASWNGSVAASVTNGKVTADGIKGSSDRSWTGEEFEGTAGSGGPSKARLSVVNGSIRIRRP